MISSPSTSSVTSPTPGGRGRGASLISRLDSKERMDTAAIQATYDLEEQKLQQEEQSHRATIFAKICTALGNGLWENTNALRRVVYSPEWTASDLRSSLFYSSWIHFTLHLVLAVIGIAVAPFPSFLVVSVLPLGLSFASPLLVQLFVTPSSVRSEEPCLVLFALPFIAILAPAFGGVSISVVSTFFSTHGTAHGPWWSFWVIMQTILSITFGFCPSVYSILLLVKLHQLRVRRELGNDLLTTSTTIQAGLLAVARTTDKVIEKNVRNLQGMIEVGGDEIAQLEKIVFGICQVLHLDENQLVADNNIGASDGTDEVKSKYDSVDRHNNSGIVLMTEDSSEEDRIASAKYLTNIGEASLRTKGVKRKTVRFENIA